MPVPDAAAMLDGAPDDQWVIEPRQHRILERARELWKYRRLWWFFAGEMTSDLYRRSKLGWLWLLLRVTAPVGLNAFVFGGVLGVESDGPPYFLFFLCGSTTWVLFERSLFFVTRSLEDYRKLVTQIYFPRLILPIAAIGPGLLYFLVLFVLLVATVVYFFRAEGVWYVTFRPQLLAAVAAVLMSLSFTIAVGLWTSVLQARYRDIRYALRYTMPFWFYFTPIIYPVSGLPDYMRWIVAVNPMAPIVEMFKWGTLGVGHLTVTGIVTSLSLIVATFISGMWFFNREEATSIDRL